MIVGSTTQVRLTEEREWAFSITTGSPTLSITNPDGTAYGSSPSIKVGTPGDGSTQYLFANITPTQGGPYKLRWSYQDDDGETIVRLHTAFATWTDAPGYVRRRLQETPVTWTDGEIEPELASAARLILARWPAIGTGNPSASVGVYNGITGDDQAWFDEAISLFVAARMVGPRTSGGSATDVVRGQVGNNSYQLAETSRGQNEAPLSPGDPGSGPGGYSGQNERVRWIREAAQAIGRIQCVRDAIQTSGATFNRFVFNGPTRTARANGVVPTLMSNIIRTLTDDFDATLNGYDFNYD